MKQTDFNHLLDLVEPSRSVMLLAKVRKLQETDPTICNLTGGEPDFDTPKPICDEVYRQLLSGCTHYSDSKGDPGLRQALARKLKEENKAPYPPDQILITPGGKYAVYLAVQALLNPGDEALWLTPGWVSYPAIITLCGGVPVPVRLDRNTDYRITKAQLEAKTTEKTRLLIINYPNNPTGQILSEPELAELKSYLSAHPGIYCISDEIYEKILYDNARFLSPAGDPELFDRIITINGFSKAYAMTGWRIGYLACCAELYGRIQKIFQHSMSCTSAFIQKGAIKALQLPEETERMRSAYERRRNRICEGLRDVPHLQFKAPRGSFYLWVCFDTAMGSEQLCEQLLEKAGIGGIPGSAFGVEEDCMVRFCFAQDDETIDRFIDRLGRFCRERL
ncbi:MAG: pyridoxal phosphate-dependent aminotransferase [Parasporobacterium sp.]|nr:pyridoxal phosphate-dependent aminotransferase [Parasporobacterium sp.]